MGRHYIIHDGWLCKRPKFEEETGYCLLLKWQWVPLCVSVSPWLPAYVATCSARPLCAARHTEPVCVCVCLFFFEHFSKRNMRNEDKTLLNSLLKNLKVARVSRCVRSAGAPEDPFCSLMASWLQFSIKAALSDVWTAEALTASPSKPPYINRGP